MGGGGVCAFAWGKGGSACSSYANNYSNNAKNGHGQHVLTYSMVSGDSLL